MSLSRRRDPLVTETVTLQQSTDQYDAVNRDGTITSANGDAYGVALESGDSGDPVPVVRLGFCPIKVATASNNNSAKTELVVASNGDFDILPSSGGGTAYVAASTEEATDTDGEQTGAWIDCLSTGRDRTISA